jgi:hypothetical protein
MRTALRQVRAQRTTARAADSIPEGRSRAPVDEPTHYV